MKNPTLDLEYMSPRELAERWRCHVSTAMRIARRETFTHVYLGQGRNGLVRYPRKEVIAYEEERRIKPVA